MLKIQQHLRQVVLALGLAAASLTAGATVLPTYHISAAAPASANIAFLDIFFTSYADAAAVTATMSHLSGGALTEEDRSGLVSSTSDKFMFGNAGLINELFLSVDDPFAFDLNFSEGFLGAAATFGSGGSLFSIVLTDALGNLIGDEGGALQFALSGTGVNIISTSSALSVTQLAAVAVPEPADWALMLSGLVFVVTMTRRNGASTARRLAAA
jgi:hypothetical protein